MSGPAVTEDTVGTAQDQLQRLLEGLDQYQLEELVLCLQCPQLLQQRPPALPWVALRGSSTVELVSLLLEHFPGSTWQEVLAHIFRHLRLPFPREEAGAAVVGPTQGQEPQDPRKEASGLQEHQDIVQEDPEMPEEEKAHWRCYRERMKADILRMWARAPWPEDHIHLLHVTVLEHQELERVLCPRGADMRPLTVVLEGSAGVGKTTVAAKLALHWAEGVLLHRYFSFVSYISCHQVNEMGDACLADLLSLHWSPDPRFLMQKFLSHPQRLLFIVDGIEELQVPRGEAESPHLADWFQRLPATQVLLSLLRRKALPTATLLVTSRAQRRPALYRLLRRPSFVTLRGFSEDDQEEYFLRFFGDQDTAKEIMQWLRATGTWLPTCCAPLMCWVVGTYLKRQRATKPSFQLGAQSPTALYAGFFSSLVSAEAGLQGVGAHEQWGALCRLAARGMWQSTGAFPKQTMGSRALAAPFIQALLRLNILQAVASCEDCVAFIHPSFQAFFGALFYVLRGTPGCLGGLTKPQELHMLLSSALADRATHWEQTAIFFFGLLHRDVARELEGVLPAALAPATATDQVLEWAEGLETVPLIPVGHALLFQCLHEAQEASMVKQVLSHLREAHVDVCGNRQLQDAAFCLRDCRNLQKLRLSLSGLLPAVEVASGGKTPGGKMASSKIRQWQDICSVFSYGNVHELDLSNSTLNTLTMKKLCRELRNPRCKLRQLTCRSVEPRRVLQELPVVLHGNSRLTHLDLSANDLGVTVSTVIFKTLRHPACQLRSLWLASCHLPAPACRKLFLALGQNTSLTFLSLGDNDLAPLQDTAPPAPPKDILCPLQHPPRKLCLEKCNLSSDTYRGLASLLISAQKTTHLCLGFNPLQDNGVQLLCASLVLPDCALQRLELWFCQLGAPSGRYLSRALLQNRALTCLNLRRNRLGDEGVEDLCVALRGPHCRLQRLDLSACSFSVPGCGALAAALRDNRSLQVLDVGENEFGDDGMEALSQALGSSTCTLTTLGLQKCQLTAASNEHLGHLLRGSKSLVSLNLLGNDLQLQGLSMLWKAVKSSQCPLRVLGLDRHLLLEVEKELEALRSRGSTLKIQCRWDSSDPEARWCW
ncbi:NACHT, LRR and PYD domains-containing protein 13 [Sorex araneus]|uniref:NACHT, LRR and PYD domains-containing protein 13 n=1 Tax=Sorex araneus TaxID=42254 RepID=UPI002433F02E|nr:NACHT, LRR and PYD domains-containing protein 13 [Sorex araneus]